jgi:hypothetical protein
MSNQISSTTILLSLQQSNHISNHLSDHKVPSLKTTLQSSNHMSIIFLNKQIEEKKFFILFFIKSQILTT